MKAADIADIVFLRLVRLKRYGMGASRWDVGEELQQFPEKVVLAKARGLIRRGLISGCACGCRGDFELTDRGRELLEIG